MKREGQIPNDWVGRFAVKVAFRLGSKNPTYTGETMIDSYSDVFWELLLLALGFDLQVVSQMIL